MAGHPVEGGSARPSLGIIDDIVPPRASRKEKKGMNCRMEYCLNYWLKRTLVSGLLIALSPSLLQAQPTTQLQPETISAFNEYVKAVEADLQLRIDGHKPFLYLDQHPRKRFKARQGEILVESFHEDIEIPDGLIHDWAGAMFVKGATADQIVAVLQDYDRHQEIYPEVVESKLLERQGDTLRSYLRLKKEKVLTVVLNTEHEARYSKLSDKRRQLRSHSTRIAEVKDPDTEEERELPVGEDSGFLWRLNAYWDIEEVEDGVFVELSTLSLSRQPPFGLGWMINPFIKNMPRESLVDMLQATRLAIKQ